MIVALPVGFSMDQFVVTNSSITELWGQVLHYDKVGFEAENVELQDLTPLSLPATSGHSPDQETPAQGRGHSIYCVARI